ncbi:MAG TPA: flagellar biosynthesis repressor FlbT [Azospirillum sp.]|nr:flagellar biosynthesis repressor FlbT [Azospirillum sp.]
MKDLDLKPGSVAYVNGMVIARTADGALKISANARVHTKEDLLPTLEAADTPAKKIYFVLQSMLLDPANIETYRQQLLDLLCDRSEASSLNAVLRSLATIQSLAESGEIQAAMDMCRRLSDFDQAVVEAYPTAS